MLRSRVVILLLATVVITTLAGCGRTQDITDSKTAEKVVEQNIRGMENLKTDEDFVEYGRSILKELRKEKVEDIETALYAAMYTAVKVSSEEEYRAHFTATKEEVDNYLSIVDNKYLTQIITLQEPGSDEQFTFKIYSDEEQLSSTVKEFNGCTVIGVKEAADDEVREDVISYLDNKAVEKYVDERAKELTTKCLEEK